MDRIKNALERAREEHGSRKNITARSRDEVKGSPSDTSEEMDPVGRVPLLKTDKRRLEERRIIAFDAQDTRSTYFDMLRTQVLQMMDAKKWSRLAITSPTPECGKTVVSVNLALSIARVSGRQPILVDLDLRRPQIASYLGAVPSKGVGDILSGLCNTNDALFRPEIGNNNLRIIANSTSIIGASEAVSSSAMTQLVQEVSLLNKDGIQIFDLPPMLTSDDLLAFLPKVDCILLVVAVGQSTIHQVEECRRLLNVSHLLGVVLNKAPLYDRSIEQATQYGYHYR